MLRCSIWFSAVHHPHRTHDPRRGSQDHHQSKNSVQKTICCNSTSNAPDDGRMYPKHVELRIHQLNYLVASSWLFALFHNYSSVNWKWWCGNHSVNNQSEKSNVHQVSDSYISEKGFNKQLQFYVSPVWRYVKVYFYTVKFAFQNFFIQMCSHPYDSLTSTYDY